jgi:hypothetical protein
LIHKIYEEGAAAMPEKFLGIDREGGIKEVAECGDGGVNTAAKVLGPIGN